MVIDMPDLPKPISCLVSLAEAECGAAVVHDTAFRVLWTNPVHRSLFPADWGSPLTYDDWFMAAVAAGRAAPDALARPADFLASARIWQLTSSNANFARRYDGQPHACAHLRAGDAMVAVRIPFRLSSVYRYMVGEDDSVVGVTSLIAARRTAAQLETLIDATGIAMAVVDADGRVLWRTERMEAVLESSGGLTLDDAGRLEAIEPEDQARLRYRIRSAAGTIPVDDPTPILLRRRRGLPLVASAVPSAATKGLTALLISGHGAAEREMEVMRRALGITRAQAEIGFGLKEGLSIQNIAEYKQLQANSIQIQLKKMFGRLAGSGIAINTQQRFIALAARVTAMAGFARQ